jgi:hypothetical protein
MMIEFWNNQDSGLTYCKMALKVPFPLSAGDVPPELSFVPDSSLRWALASKELRLQTPILNFSGERVARAILADNSLRPGRLTDGDPFEQNCNVAC